MKIALVGPGIMPIPPPGWGAVEILIWDYYNELCKLGHDVVIINTKDMRNIVDQVNAGAFDFVHVHYDVFYQILPYLTCPRIAITSHYPYIDQVDKHRADGYSRVFQFLVEQQKYYNFVLANKDYDAFLAAGANPLFLRKIKNGINSDLFSFSEKPVKMRTLYLGKITPRKNQAVLQKRLPISMIDFVGNNADPSFNTRASNYMGSWTREQIYSGLTRYANLLLLSEGEADPLVVKEALIAGLGVVVNRSSSENLDTSLPFITVLDDDKMMDPDYVLEKLSENKDICIGSDVVSRQQIRQYGIQQFDIKQEVQSYMATITVL